MPKQRGGWKGAPKPGKVVKRGSKAAAADHDDDDDVYDAVRLLAATCLISLPSRVALPHNATTHTRPAD